MNKQEEISPVKDNPKSPKKEESSEGEKTKPIKDKWKSIYVDLGNEIKIRHYSPKTLKAYATWVKKFQYFTHSKEIQSLSSSDVKEFLTYLAVKRKVSATPHSAP